MIELSPNALRVLEARYLRRDAAGQVVESPEGLFKRVAHGVASAEAVFATDRAVEEWESVLLASLDFLPTPRRS
jgi:ribonucleoside-diphosphate reductase alpha chain